MSPWRVIGIWTILTLIVVSPLTACDGGSGKPGDMAADSDGSADISELDEDQVDDVETDVDLFGVEELKADYGIIETVAGTGLIPEKGVNGWLPEYEEGLATEAELSRPHIAMEDETGNLYIADKDAHAIRRVDPSGRITTVAGTGVAGDGSDIASPGTATQLDSPNGLYVLPDGNVFILDLGNDKVRRLSTDGMIQTVFRIEGAGDGRGLWVSPDQSEIWVSAGTELKRWQRGEGVVTVADGFLSLGNIHRSPMGFMGVTDRAAHLVYRVESNGTRTVIAGNGQTSGGGPGAVVTAIGLDEVRGIYFHPRGGYFLATHNGGRIWYVDRNDRIHLFVDGDSDDSHAGDGEPFDAPGAKISEPRAVTMTPRGDVLITEHDAGYVRRVRFTGD